MEHNNILSIVVMTVHTILAYKTAQALMPIAQRKQVEISGRYIRLKGNAMRPISKE